MIKWGFIGCGDVVEHKSGKPFWLAGQSEVVAVTSRRIESAKAFAQRNGIADYYDSVPELLQNPAVDAVYIATPPSTHIPYAKLALAAGKAVYLEKPMGITLAECEDAAVFAQQKGLPLLVAYYRRSLPYFQTVKQRLDSGEIGQVQAVNVTQFSPPQGADAPAWKRDVAQAGGGLFYDVGCHALDILDYLLGPIAAVQGVSKVRNCQGGMDDTVACQLSFASGALGTALWCFESGAKQDSIQIIGSKGQLVCQLFAKDITITVGGETRVLEIPAPAYVQQPMVHHVVALLQGQAVDVCTADIALRTARVMQAIVDGGK